MESLEILKLMLSAIEDKKGEHISVLDIREVSSLADYFVIASGNNLNQIQAISDDIQEKLAAVDVRVKRVEGANDSTWILLDYADIVIHLFTKEDRMFYDLDRIWADAKKVNLE